MALKTLLGSIPELIRGATMLVLDALEASM